MAVDKPGPGEELNTGPPTTPRRAASVIVLRGGADALEVLLVKRNPQSRFMGGAWVFPGGSVDGEEDLRATAVREVMEEVQIALPDPEALVPFARWIISSRFGPPPSITYSSNFTPFDSSRCRARTQKPQKVLV